MHRFSKLTGALLIVDIQERLAHAMNAQRLDRVLNRTLAAIEGARALELPIVVTEQYPKGLGPTVPALLEKLSGVPRFEKLEFSAWSPQVHAALHGRLDVLVVGMETHVCVFQTVRDLAKAGLRPYLAADAVLSRHELDERVGVELCRDSGAQVTTVEAALFDAMERAGGPVFKAISAAVK